MLKLFVVDALLPGRVQNENDNTSGFGIVRVEILEKRAELIGFNDIFASKGVGCLTLVVMPDVKAENVKEISVKFVQPDIKHRRSRQDESELVLRFVLRIERESDKIGSECNQRQSLHGFVEVTCIRVDIAEYQSSFFTLDHESDVLDLSQLELDLIVSAWEENGFV